MLIKYTHMLIWARVPGTLVLFHYTITPIVPAAITTGASDVTVLESNNATFTCTFEANPIPTQYMWQFTDSTGTTMELMNGDEYIIQSSSGDNSFTTMLTVTSTKYDDRGTFSCSATNIIDGTQYTDSDSADLTVHGKQHFLILYYYTVSPIVLVAVTIGASDATVLESNNATFTCAFEGNPTPTQYMWQFTDSTGTTMELMDGDEYIILSSSGDNSFTTMLTVTSTEYDDRGTYSCSASNMIDGTRYTDSDSASLTVNGKQLFLILDYKDKNF